MRNISDKVTEKVRTYTLRSKIPFRKGYHLQDKVENFVRTRQATDGNIMRRRDDDFHAG
jgi:hypothetical protein